MKLFKHVFKQFPLELIWADYQHHSINHWLFDPWFPACKIYKHGGILKITSSFHRLPQIVILFT